MVSKEDLDWRGVSGSTQREPYERFTLHRVANSVFILCHFAAMICHIVCFAVLLNKHKEIADTFNYHPKKHICILYMKSVGSFVDFDGKHTCDFVIYGSISLTILAVINMIILAVRTYLVKKMNFLGLYDVIVTTPAAVLSFSIAVVVSIGRSETCNAFTKDLYNTCPEIYLIQNPDQKNPRVGLYGALKSSETSSWVAFLFLTIITVMALVRTILWYRRLRDSRKATLSTGLIHNEEPEPVDENKTPSAI